MEQLNNHQFDSCNPSDTEDNLDTVENAVTNKIKDFQMKLD